MKYKEIVSGEFIARPNRFIAYCTIDGVKHKCHVKNTGRCKELLLPGATVYLERSNNPNRKTEFSLVSVRKNEQIINIDSQSPNKIAYDAIVSGAFRPFGLKGTLLEIKREVTYGNSRFDLFIKTDKEEGFIEVKGVTLKENRIAMFPDAPTERGRKHVLELIKAKQQGYYASALLVLQMTNCSAVTANWYTDPPFSTAITEAKNQGVIIQGFDCSVTKDTISYHEPIPVLFQQNRN